ASPSPIPHGQGIEPRRIRVPSPTWALDVLLERRRAGDHARDGGHDTSVAPDDREEHGPRSRPVRAELTNDLRQARELPKGVLRLRLRARRAFRRAGRRAPARRRQHRGRIEAVNNACRAREVVVEEGSLAAFVWRFERANTPWSRRSARPRWRRSPAPRTSSDAKFVGPT